MSQEDDSKQRCYYKREGSNVYIAFLLEVGLLTDYFERSAIVYMLNSGSFRTGSKSLQAFDFVKLH